MAPAGDDISLAAALQSGADAVYFGLGAFNMRANAGNFPLRGLPSVVKKIHGAGAKAYLTLNTIMLPGDGKQLHRTIAAAAGANVDAVIAWDFSVIEAARRAGLNVYISTQMSVSNASAILFFYWHLGIRRFVLARECSLGDIRSIRRSLARELGEKAGEIEIEVFVHGAMCLSVSGRCQLSQFQFGKSANRGACGQPCRRRYAISEVREGYALEVGEDFILSPKDLCALPFLEKLFAAGVNSLKIEGRQRSAEYVATVTRAYRRIIDLWFGHPRPPDFAGTFAAAKREEMIHLQKVFNRGFSSGFYLGKPVAEWSAQDTQATHRKQYVGETVNYYKQPRVAAVHLDGAGIAVGDEIMIHGPTTGVREAVVSSIEDEGRAVQQAGKGRTVGIAFPELVRPGDKVYRMNPVAGAITGKTKQSG
ncbi:MAG TPA: peptidase U32 family protein [Candidatus Ozemobacteraceae bacterium]|nr:peptidase U32 family protein [Candidatus Ozemobacteraceae bacterium]